MRSDFFQIDLTFIESSPLEFLHALIAESLDLLESEVCRNHIALNLRKAEAFIVGAFMNHVALSIGSLVSVLTGVIEQCEMLTIDEMDLAIYLYELVSFIESLELIDPVYKVLEDQ